jgi:hypothetical protein
LACASVLAPDREGTDPSEADRGQRFRTQVELVNDGPVTIVLAVDTSSATMPS